MKKIGLASISLFLPLLIVCLVWWQWQRYGVAAEQKNEICPVTEKRNVFPRLYVASRRVKQGERIPLSRLASASDIDGSDLSGNVKCYTEKGEEVSCFLDTATPGQYFLTWRVKSVMTGKTIQKKTILLVDGRVAA